MGPIATLLTGDSLQLYSLDGLIDHAATKQRVVDTQRALLIGAQDESRAKLLVEITCRNLHVLHRTALHIEVGHTPSFEVLLEAGQRVFQKLEACTSIDILALQGHLSIGVRECPVVGGLCANGFVVLWNEDVALYASRHDNLLVLCIHQHRRSQCKRYCQ